MALNNQRFHILVALANGPLHGYAIAEEIRTVSNGELTPRAGALYHAIDKLVEQGLTELDQEEIVEGRLRRSYRLTEEGRTVLASEAASRQRSASIAIDRLNLNFKTNSPLQSRLGAT